MRYSYRVFGLNVHSDIECPHLMADTEPVPDVIIRLGEVPNELEAARRREKHYEVGAGQFLLRVKQVARYLVSAGREIVVEPLPDVAAGDVQLFLLGSVMGALLYQRGAWPLHGSAIASPRGAALFVGAAGIGKSTLVGEFYKRGFQVLSDDVCALLNGDDGSLQMWPALPRLRLWSDSVVKLGGETDQLTRVRARIDKYNVPLERFAHEPSPVAAVYVLSASDTQTTLELTPLKGFDKVKELTTNTYRLQFLTDMQLTHDHFEQAQVLAKQARVVRVTRPAEPFLLDELADAIERDLAV